jgi:SGNH hydrolase-like domain, acetyltransferase AlgX
MSRRRAFLLNSLTALASTVFTLLSLELLFNFLPVARTDQPPVQAPTPTDPVQRYAPNAPFVWSLGWNFYVVSRGRTNTQGFVADYDYDASATTPLVAVVGDSFVEALMMPFSDTLTGRLQAVLGSHGRAYAFAQQGAPLTQYVAYARHACTVYHPQKLVVVVVGNDFDESIYEHRRRNGIFHLYPRADGGLDYKLTPLPEPALWERIARRSALLHYIVRNAGWAELVQLFQLIRYPDATAKQTPFVGNTSAEADPARLAEGEQVIAWFLDALPQAACLSPSDIVLTIDAMRPEIYDDITLATAGSSYFGRMRAELISSAHAKGFVVVDMEAPFRVAYAADARPFEYPTDGHWNPHGHAVAATAVREALAPWPALAR